MFRGRLDEPRALLWRATNADSLWERSIKHTLKVWRFLDGKPGHEKQTQGLLQGLEGLVEVEARDLHWPADAKALKKIGTACGGAGFDYRCRASLTPTNAENTLAFRRPLRGVDEAVVADVFI